MKSPNGLTKYPNSKYMTTGNYLIVELPTWKVYGKKDGNNFTLSEAKNEIKNAHCFGILNATTNKMVVFHTYNGYIFPLQTIKRFPERCNQIVRNRTSFNYHPQQD